MFAPINTKESAIVNKHRTTTLRRSWNYIGLRVLMYVLATLLAAPAALGQSVRIKNNGLEFEGVGYYKANAGRLQLGSWGDKKTPIGGANYLDEQGIINVDKMKLGITSFSFSDVESNENDFKAETSFAGLGDVSAGAAWSGLKSGKYQLLMIDINPKEQLIKAVNGNNGLVEKLADFEKGNQLRIVSAVFVVVSLDESVSKDLKGTLEVKDIKLSDG